MLSTRRPGRDVLGGRLLPQERRGARTSVVVPVLPPDRLFPYPPPSDEGNCHDACEHPLLVTSYQVRMRLIGLAVVLTLSLILAPLAAEAQQAGRVARVGFLNNSAPPPSTEELMKGIAWNPFWTAMRELGWMEGQNMVVEHQWANHPISLVRRLPSWSGSRWTSL